MADGDKYKVIDRSQEKRLQQFGFVVLAHHELQTMKAEAGRGDRLPEHEFVQMQEMTYTPPTDEQVERGARVLHGLLNDKSADVTPQYAARKVFEAMVPPGPLPEAQQNQPHVVMAGSAASPDGVTMRQVGSTDGAFTPGHSATSQFDMSQEAAMRATPNVQGEPANLTDEQRAKLPPLGQAAPDDKGVEGVAGDQSADVGAQSSPQPTPLTDKDGKVS